MVYVDELREHDTPLRFKIWCHMTADSLGELHEMAEKIGMRREWFQLSRKGVPHYDLPAEKRDLALLYGAVEEHSRARVRRVRANA
jgi:hypothetical protein